MNHDEAARRQWWGALTDSERSIWLARARSAGTDAWELKKASIFDRGVTFDELLGQLDKDGSLPATPANCVDKDAVIVHDFHGEGWPLTSGLRPKPTAAPGD